MKFKKFISKVADKIGDTAENLKEAYDERQERKMEEQDLEDEISNKIEELFDKFEMNDFKDLCKNVLGDEPETGIEEDDDGEEYKVKPKRKDYLEFIEGSMDGGELSFDQLKNFSLRRNIVSKNFFDFENRVTASQSEFEEIIKTIQNDFPAEKIFDEKELQAQLTIFLKTKYPDSDVERERIGSDRNSLDIVMDDKYAFELKVPSSRTELRNLRGQIEEYLEDYPNLCVVIYDNEDYNVSEDIEKYVDIYQQKYDVPSVVLHGRKRR